MTHSIDELVALLRETDPRNCPARAVPVPKDISERDVERVRFSKSSSSETSVSQVALPFKDTATRATKATVESGGTTTEEIGNPGTTVEETPGEGTTVERSDDAPLVPSKVVKRFGRDLGYNADPLPTPTLKTLRLRLEVEMGLRKLYPVNAAPVPKTVGEHGQKVADHVVYLFGVRWLTTAGEPAPLTLNWMQNWCSMSEWQVRVGLHELKRDKWLIYQYSQKGLDYWLPRLESEES